MLLAVLSPDGHEAGNACNWKDILQVCVAFDLLLDTGADCANMR